MFGAAMQYRRVGKWGLKLPEISLGEDLAGHRDEIVVSTKAGWDMWPGP